jgi:hypothetical protein
MAKFTANKALRIKTLEAQLESALKWNFQSVVAHIRNEIKAVQAEQE